MYFSFLDCVLMHVNSNSAFAIPIWVNLLKFLLDFRLEISIHVIDYQYLKIRNIKKTFNNFFKKTQKKPPQL